MKKIVLFTLFLLALANVWAESNATNKAEKSNSENASVLQVKGTVQDITTGETLAGVEIKLEGTDLKTYTDLDGNFSISNVKPGEYKVTANYISYRKNTETLKVTTGSSIRLKLQPSN